MKKFRTEVDHVLKTLEGLEPDSEEYAETVRNLKTLCEARKIASINWEIPLQVGAQIISILLLLNFEKFNIVTSKALQFVRRF